MIQFSYKETINIVPALTVCFATDKELLDKYHIEAPADLNTCVARTYFDLQKAKNFKFFVIGCTEDISGIVGFFGKETIDGINFLTSFFIKPQFRHRDMMDFLWTAIEEELGIDFFTALYEKNTRAKKFLERNGMKLIGVKEIEKNINALIFN